MAIPIKAGGYLGQYNMPLNYSMTFKIKPVGKNYKLTNIIHITKAGSGLSVIGARVGSIWFSPNTFKLVAQIGSDGDWDFGAESTTELALNAVTDVKIDVQGAKVSIYLNGKLSGEASCSSRISPVYSGFSDVYVGNNIDTPANATISMLSIKRI